MVEFLPRDDTRSSDRTCGGGGRPGRIDCQAQYRRQRLRGVASRDWRNAGPDRQSIVYCTPTVFLFTIFGSMRKRRVTLLGSTGSIGASAIKVAETMPDRMEILGMAAHSSARKLAEAANRSRPQAVCLVDPASLGELRSGLNYSPKIFSGEEGLI